MRNYIFMAILIAVLCGLLKFSKAKIKNQKAEIDRLEANQDVLLSDIAIYRTKEGKLAASVQALTLSKSEIEKNCSDLTDKIKDMRLEIKRLKEVRETAIKSEYEIKSKFEDLVKIRNDTDTLIHDSLKCINSVMPYINIEGCVNKEGIFTGKVTTTDTIFQAVHVVPKRFLFIKYGVKAIRQDIKMANPDANITYSRYIQIKK